jgi:cation transporter-like permease
MGFLERLTKPSNLLTFAVFVYLFAVFVYLFTVFVYLFMARLEFLGYIV